MSFTKVAPAGIGTEPGNLILIGDSLLHSTGIDIGNNTGIGVTIRKHGDATFTGIITASAFFGDGSGLEGVSSSGIGTPLSDDDTSDLNKIYYVNQELSIGSTVTVNHPSSAVASYTHYQDLVVTDDADFIVSDGDTFIPDVLGIRTSTSTASAATGGRIRAGTITNAGANGAVNFPNGLVGTSATFTGVLTYEDVTNVDSIGVVTARAGVNVVGNDLNVGSNIKLGNASGIITATSFRGDASQMTGAGLGTDGSANTSGIITATAFVPTTGQLSHRNKVINGAMTVSQRGSSFTSDGYTLDRFERQQSSDGAFTITPSTTSPDGFAKSLKVDVTTADTSLAAAQYAQIKHKIEAQDLQDLAFGTSAAKNIVLSFYVRSNKTGNYGLWIQQSDNSFKQVTLQYTINSADTWERKTFSIAGDTSGVINDDNGDGFIIAWGLASGTNKTSGSLRSSWTAQAAADQFAGQGVNLLDSTSNEWYLTGVQLEVGPVATPFEHRSFGDELARCQRYYYMHHNTSKTGTEGNYRVLCLGFASGTTEVTGHIFFPVTMRANPSIDANSGVVGGIGYWRIGGGVHGGDKYIDGAWALASPTTRSTRIYATPRVSLTNGATGYIDGRNDASYMAFSAEL